MQKALFVLSRQLLSQDIRDRVKLGIARSRKRASPLLRRLHGSFDAEALQEALARALPRQFDALMVHCSYDDLHPMYQQGVNELLTAIRAICGPDRTLMMPAFTYDVPGGDLVKYFESNPRFDARRQPSRMGLLSEVFRRTPGVLRSLHPTHSICALGPQAAWLVGEHHFAATTCGERTPFARMAEIDTVILGLGKPYYRVLTQVHAAEDLMGDRYHRRRTFRRVPVMLADASGEFPYTLRVEVDTCKQRLDRLAKFMPAGALTEFRFHGVPIFWTRAEAVTRVLCGPGAAAREVFPT
jgi:aminoglycoside 3-N-acetyltransferase